MNLAIVNILTFSTISIFFYLKHIPVPSWFLSCKDEMKVCGDYKAYCHEADMKKYCKLTCGTCDRPAPKAKASESDEIKYFKEPGLYEGDYYDE